MCVLGVNKMRKLKRILCLVFAFAICMAFASCNGEKDKKYDVAIRVVSSDKEVYEFSVNTVSLSDTITYDGTERTYYVSEYNLPNHPRWSNEWISANNDGANVFGITIVYFSTDGGSSKAVDSVKEKGEYNITIEARATSTLWKPRTVHLVVTVE